MAMRLGSGNLIFEPVEGWEKLPEGWEFIDVAGVAVDARDHVYVFNRGAHPVIVFDRDGNLLRTFGEGIFSQRPHGIHTGPDESVYCVDDGLHTIQKFSLDGKLLMTLGSPNQPAPKWQGKPFNRPTHVAVSRVTGHLYVSDGYGNSRIQVHPGRSPCPLVGRVGHRRRAVHPAPQRGHRPRGPRLHRGPGGPS